MGGGMVMLVFGFVPVFVGCMGLVGWGGGGLVVLGWKLIFVSMGEWRLAWTWSDLEVVVVDVVVLVGRHRQCLSAQMKAGVGLELGRVQQHVEFVRDPEKVVLSDVG